jgi:hypothetical protein
MCKSSPVKPSKHIASHNREEVADNLKAAEIPAQTSSKQFLDRRGSLKSRRLKEVGDNDFVSHLNNLSRTICEEDKGK